MSGFMTFWYRLFCIHVIIKIVLIYILYSFTSIISAEIDQVKQNKTQKHDVLPQMDHRIKSSDEPHRKNAAFVKNC